VLRAYSQPLVAWWWQSKNVRHGSGASSECTSRGSFWLKRMLLKSVSGLFPRSTPCKMSSSE
jgi:hypothetical protein